MITPTSTGPLDTESAAQALGLSPRTLEKYRVSGHGPAYLKLGRLVRYEREDLETWKDARRVRSTSEQGCR